MDDPETWILNPNPEHSMGGVFVRRDGPTGKKLIAAETETVEKVLPANDNDIRDIDDDS